MQAPHPAARLLRETLDAIVSPEVRDALVAEALAAANQAEVPRMGEGFEEFAAGPLRNAVERGLGEALAASLLSELSEATERQQAFSNRPTPRRQHMPRRSMSPAPGATPRQSTPSAPRAASVPLTRVTPEARMPGGAWRSDQYPAGAARTLGLISDPPRAQSEAPGSARSTPPAVDAKSTRPPSTARPQTGSARPLTAQDATAVPIVLVATTDGRVVSSFDELLRARAEVAPIQSISDLVLLLDASPKSKVVLVVDCSRPTIRPTAVAALSDELSHRVSVILWGADERVYEEILNVSPRAERFLMCAATASPDAVAARCRAIVG
ncbi:MAG: hypothetical protein R3B13_13220 [Polyangiaceae bacterium]